MSNSTNIRRYIAFRYDNWRDYAEYMSREHGFNGWGEDLLNDIVAELLAPAKEQKIAELLSRETAEILNGRKTTELDKFVLQMLKINACSPTAPFRKNVLGQKVISRQNKTIEVARTVEINGYDSIDDGYDEERADRLDSMHARNIRRLREAGYTAESLALYDKHFIKGQPVRNGEQLAVANICNFLKRK